ncbi:MAG: diguanylate cyclase [Pseudomonadota bacterium]
MRVLVAEDDPVTRRLLQSHLTRWGYEVVVCVNGAVAWETLRREDTPRLAILDWMMPEKDGLAICRDIRKQGNHPYIYIILVTARNQREDVVEGLEAGADDYISKPFNPHELKVRVRAGSRIVRLQEDLLSALEAAEYQASHDPLTGLWNRGAILKVLTKELARSKRSGESTGVLMGDVDHFKRVNDDHGHQAGDSVLRGVTARMTEAIREYDFCGRYGGEEFLLVLPGCRLEDAAALAERIRLLFSGNPLTTAEGVFDITISFGVTAFDGKSELDADAVIRHADEAMYRAKNAGRNRVETGPVPVE